MELIGRGNAMLYRSTTYPLIALVSDIARGAIGLPELQRPFVWPNAQIRDLFDSLYRGYEILLSCEPANPAPAEDAFVTAIAVAKRQGARSFELRAALVLAKLYQSIARPADAHAVL